MSKNVRRLVFIEISILVIGIMALIVLVASERKTDVPRPPAWQTQLHNIQMTNAEMMKEITATAFAKAQSAGR